MYFHSFIGHVSSVRIQNINFVVMVIQFLLRMLDE
uniref:Uncharacterized protein n=1 Tax=Heterorhabditis bacteriophora TaxID=37862 RepID=A0A1I7WY22_HETBA